MIHAAIVIAAYVTYCQHRFVVFVWCVCLNIRVCVLVAAESAKADTLKVQAGGHGIYYGLFSYKIITNLGNYSFVAKMFLHHNDSDSTSVITCYFVLELQKEKAHLHI